MLVKVHSTYGRVLWAVVDECAIFMILYFHCQVIYKTHITVYCKVIYGLYIALHNKGLMIFGYNLFFSDSACVSVIGLLHKVCFD